MKTILSKVTAGLLVLGLMLIPIQAMSAPYYFWWQVVDEYGTRLPSQTTTCSVYDLASHGAKVMYLAPSLAPHAGIQTSMPLLSDANSRFHFYSESNADVRVVCYYARGGAATDLRISVNSHNVMIDRQGRKVVRFPFVTNATTTKTSVWIPRGSIIRDILVQSTYYGAQALTQGEGAGGSNTNPEPHLNVGFAGNHAVSLTHALVDRMHLAGQPEWIRPGLGLWFSPAVGGVGGAHYSTGFGVHRGFALASAPRGAVSAPGNHQGLMASFEIVKLVTEQGGLELTYQTSNTPNVVGHVYVIFDSYHTGLSTQPTQ